MGEVVLVTIPQETVNDVSVRIVSWQVTSGSWVDKDQKLCEVETSKAVMEIEAPVAGVVVFSAAIGDEVPVGATICQIAPKELDRARVAPATSSADADNVVVPTSPITAGVGPTADMVAGTVVESPAAATALPPARLTPLATKLATEFGLSVDSFARGSVVRRDDVLKRAGKFPLAVTGSVTPAADAIHASTESLAERAAPVPGVPLEWAELPRRKLLETKVLGQGRAWTLQSQVTTSLRAPQLRARLERIGLADVGLGALIVFEGARLLRKYPEFNAVHSRGSVGKYSDVNIGWAIDGGQGLMVPVIPLADTKTPSEIREIMLRQIDAYVAGALSAADFLGGTFTISDLSSDGITHFQPLISQGQSAILGVGGELDEAGAETLYLTLAFDHQLAEGRKAAQFVRDLAARLEAHGKLHAAAPPSTASNEDGPYCSLCNRDREALRAMKAMLVVSELPAGYVCSLCLGELS